MEVTDDNLLTLANYLQQTLNPDPNVRRPAEKFLEGVEGNQNYAILLLHLIDKDGVDMTIRVAAAIAFKNFIKRNWPVEDENADRIHSADRLTIKTLIVSLMLKSPEAIQRQFSDAVSIIGRYDFPDKWPNLIPEMVDKFATGDFHVINGVLRTAHSLFKRYRFEFKSQKLWVEIKLVLDAFAKPLTDLFVATIDLTTVHANNSQALSVIYGSLVLICKVFYSLNYQDLPEFFEDNMKIWMPNLLNLLQVKVPCLETNDDEDTPGVMEQLRTEVCECAALYALKYEEEFSQYAQGFVTAVWTVLLSTSPQTKYDALVSNALTFLSKVAEKKSYKNLFEDPGTLSSICEKVVIPNMEFRESDMELFEDNPEEYVRRDIEGSDVDTRRRAACDLVKTLAQHYDDKMMHIFGQYVQMMLAKYAESGPSAWRGKDAAMYLVTSLASRGGTQAAGVTKASPLVDLAQFAANHALPELQRQPVTELPVLKADAIKYLMTFRTLLPKDLVLQAVPLIIHHITGRGVVLTYAACCIEKLIVGGMVPKTALEPYAPALLQALFQALAAQHEAGEHNEYVMKAILRTLACLQESSLTYLGQALPNLAHILSVIAKNPSKPHFNHYLFETLSLAVSLVTKANPNAISAFEETLFPIFQDILQNDIQEFMPYVFQMLSLLLELRGTSQASGPGGDAYGALLPCLVAPPLWERAANVRPLVRLLCAFVAFRTELVLNGGKFNAILGVFQKLIASKTNDHEGFYLMQTIYFKYGLTVMQQYTKQIMTLLFQRLSSSKTTKYVRGLVAFFGFFAAHYGADALIDIVDSVQENLFGMYVDRVLITDLQRVTGVLERKAAAIGCVKLLCQSEHFRQGNLAPRWPLLMQALISLFELPPDDTTLPDDHFIEVDDAPGYQAQYSQLTCAKGATNDPLASIEEPKRYLAESFGALSRECPGLLPPRLAALEPRYRDTLQTYLAMYSVQMDEVEQNLAIIFGEEEAESFREERRRRRTVSNASEASFHDAELSDVHLSDRSSDSAESSNSVAVDGETDGSGDEWVQELGNPEQIPFTKNPGVLIENASGMSPIDYFKILFNVNFLSMISDMTNEHAQNVINKGFKPQSRLKRWKPTNAKELLTFLGVLFFMGTVRLSRVDSYWAKSHLVKFNLGNYMSRNRFLLILRMLYFKFNDADSSSVYDILEILINYVNQIMKTCVYPERELSVDESMVLFRGRLLIRQYMKNKRHKSGVKLYILADPNGLVHRIHMYKGSADSEVGGIGHVKKVVLKLLNDYLNAGHSVYMDSFFNSVDLAEILLSKKTYCTGTLQSNRKRNPVAVTSKKLTRGGSVYRKNSKGVCVMKWKDRRDVLTLSTEHSPEHSDVLNRRGRVVSKPNIILQYDKYMKGVDRHDQMLAYYPCEHKMIRWYKKIAIHIFQMMFLNAYFLYKKGTGKTLSLEVFRDKVLSDILPPPTVKTLPPQFPTHMPKQMERNNDGVLRRRKCARCWKKNNKRRDSGMFCPDCDIGLCITCFGPYHVEMKMLQERQCNVLT